MLLAVDVGGTFTDAVLLSDRGPITAKTQTTPEDESIGVLAAVERVLAAADVTAEAVTVFAHGTTVGTNALLTGSGARTALVATEGFTDLLEIARQDRPSLYRLCEARPMPLIAAADRVGAVERVGPEGVITPLTDGEVAKVCDELERITPEAVAIGLLFSYLHPEHERRLAAAIRERLGSVHVSASSEVLPTFREYERCSTTVIDAHLAPLLASYLARLAEGCELEGLPMPLLMRSSGGLATLDEATSGGVWSVLSGPAGGAIGTELTARLSGVEDAIGLDMGGTSCDVCVVDAGQVRRTDNRVIAGRVVQLPMVDVETVGAGGGSIAWADPGGAMRVGPGSAGSVPGPACYGRGGVEPTVTDANLMLGYLPSGGELADAVSLDRGRAEAAIAGLATELGLDPTGCAAGIAELANHEMLRALRVMTVERGVDPRTMALVAFGGAGPLHAAAIATELEITTVLCPRAAGVLSALGMTAAKRRRESTQTVNLSGAALTPAAVTAATTTLINTLRTDLTDPPADLEVSVTYGVRYSGQSFELSIAADSDPDLDRLAEDFAVEHHRRYGYRDPEAAIEIVNVSVALTLSPGAESIDGSEIGGPEHDPVRSQRPAFFNGEWMETTILRGEPVPGVPLTGPAVLERSESTVVVPPGWDAAVDEHGTVELARGEAGG